MEQKQAFEVVNIFPPGPKTERGQGTVIHVHKNRLIYCTSNLVVLRNLDNFSECEFYQGHREQVTCAKLSPNGNWVCSGDAKGNIHIWDALGKDHVARYTYEKYMPGAVKDLAWTSDNQRVAAVGEGKELFARAFLIETGSKVGDLNMNGKQLITVDIRQPRPFRLALAGEEFNTNWYEGPPYKWKKTQKFHSSFVNCLRFSPDGKYFATVSSDRKIVLYDGREGEMIKEFKDCHSGGIWQFCWVDNTTIATSSGDKTVKVWNISESNDLELKQTLNVAEKPKVIDQQVSVQSSGNKIISLSLGGIFNIFNDFNTAQKPDITIEQHLNYVTFMEYSQDSLISGDKNGKILIWQNGTATLPQGEPHSLEISRLSVSQNGQFVYSLCKKGEIKQIDLQTKQFTKSLTIDKQVLDIVALGDDELQVLCGDEIQIYKNMQLASQISLQGFQDPTVFDVASTGYAVGSLRGKIQLFRDGKTHSLNHLSSKITLVKFGHGNLYTGDSTGKIYVWNAATGELKSNRWSFHSSAVQNINILGKWIISSGLDNKVVIFDSESLEKVVDYPNLHSQSIFSSCVTPQGQIFTGGSDCLIKQINPSINLA